MAQRKQKASAKKPPSKRKAATKKTGKRKSTSSKSAGGKAAVISATTSATARSTKRSTTGKKTVKPRRPKTTSKRRPSAKKTSSSKTPAKKTSSKGTTKKAAALKKTRQKGRVKTTTLKGKAARKTATGKKSRAKPAARRKVAKVSKVHKPPVKPPFPAYKGSKPYIFTSYAHEDMKTVFKVIKNLNKSRYRIWYDEGIEPGFEWPEVVGKAIIKCSQFIVFMSPYATMSRNVRNEINLAFTENKDILVIFLEETRLTEGMMLQIGTVQFINKYELTEKEFFDKLKKVINSTIRL
jgi:hypothetical protein